MNLNLRRAVTTISSVTIVSVSVVAPVFASGNSDDGEDRGTPMPLTTAVLLFVVTPILVSFGIALLVSLPGWVRKAKASTVNGFLDDPTLADRQVESPNRSAISRY